MPITYVQPITYIWLLNNCKVLMKYNYTFTVKIKE